MEWRSSSRIAWRDSMLTYDELYARGNSVTKKNQNVTASCYLTFFLKASLCCLTFTRLVKADERSFYSFVLILSFSWGVLFLGVL
jgi:hypothetical protein